MGRCASLTALLAVATGIRVVKKGTDESDGETMSISGVAIHNYRSDATRWVVIFREGTSNAALEAWCDDKCELLGHPDQSGIAFVELACDAQELEAIVEAKSNDEVEFIEPDPEMIAYEDAEEGEDTEEGEALSTASWGLSAVGVPSRPRTGRNVDIYVLDTGIRVSHRDFDGRAVATLDLTSNRLVECRGSTSCAGDVQGHGTHCAGTAGGRTFGVASGATLHAVKVLDDSGRGSGSWSAAALDWIAARVRRGTVASMSLGSSGVSSTSRRAVDGATSRGVVVVVAAGNSNADSCSFSPAHVPNAITVGSTDSRNRRSGFSNFGRCNDIMAPGSAITSASAGSNTGSARQSGTSMACPHVSGAAAILLEQSPTRNRNAIMSLLSSSGLRGRISGLNRNDPDLFLWVGR